MAEKPTRLERLQAQLKAEQEKAEALASARQGRALKAKANAEPKLKHATERRDHWQAQVDELTARIKGYDAVIGGSSDAEVEDEPVDGKVQED